MPELPEVETIRGDLHHLLRGKRVANFVVKKKNLLKSPRTLFRTKFVGATIQRVTRRAKMLCLELSSGYVAVLHLKMTGQLVYQNRQGRLVVGGHPIGGVAGVPNRYTYITVRLTDKSKLFFNDVRQFGYWRLVPRQDLPAVFAHLGPEPLSADFTVQNFQAHLSRRNRTSVKAAILDQSVVAGIGNIYADESLFVAKIRPGRRVKSLSRVEVQRLHRAIRYVLQKAVKARGTSFNSYVDGLGRSGTYWDKRLVYGRKGEPCPRCRRPILKTVVVGRGTHYCGYCQR